MSDPKYPNETIIPLPNGGSMRSEAGNHIRICDENGDELVYWSCDEFAEDPMEVIAALFGAATMPIDDIIKKLKFKRVVDGYWVVH